MKATFAAAAAVLGIGFSVQAAEESELSDQPIFDACVERMEAAHMPGVEHCSITTAPLSRLNPEQQEFLRQYHLYYSCAEPIWSFNYAAGKAVAEPEKEVMGPREWARFLSQTIDDMIVAEKLVDPDKYCTDIAGISFREVVAGMHRTIGELQNAAAEEKGAPLTLEEEVIYSMLFHRPFPMPIEGFEEPQAPPMPLPDGH